MAITFDGSYTGLTTFTGLTNPTYTSVSDTSVSNPRAKQHAVTAAGGTQTNVRVHSVGDPFLVRFLPPASYKTRPAANPITGKYPSIPYNVHSLMVQKGTNFASGENPLPSWIETRIGLAAGSELTDPANIRAMVCFYAALLQEIAPGLAETLVTGIP